jgi:hypothetical protein
VPCNSYWRDFFGELRRFLSRPISGAWSDPIANFLRDVWSAPPTVQFLSSLDPRPDV